MTVQKLHALADAMKNYALESNFVIGFYISGSYAKGLIHDRSDLDPVFVVDKGAKEQVGQDLRKRFDLKNCDLCVYTLDEFRNLSTAGTSGMGSDRYDYAHLTVEIDKTGGEIQKIVEQNGSLSERERLYLGAGYLDGYINSFYRSLKAAREKWDLPQRLEAAESIPHMLAFLFAADHRIVPFSKYLEWDMKKHPLNFPMEPDELLRDIKTVLSSASVATQIKLFEKVSEFASKVGFENIVKDWDGKPEALANKMKKYPEGCL